jgi:hypothetical protein
MLHALALLQLPLSISCVSLHLGEEEDTLSNEIIPSFTRRTAVRHPVQRVLNVIEDLTVSPS